MAAKPSLGYMVPQFPGQTHAFFWREVRALEAMGVEVHLFSTRPPPPGIVAHAWSEEARARTDYLASRNPLDGLRALPALPWRELRGAEPGFLRDLLPALPAARALAAAAGRRGVRHVHVHSCGRAALIAALAHRLGGPSYSLTLHNPLAVYGPGQPFKWRGARFATVVNQKLLAEVKTVLRDVLPSRVAVRAMGVDAARFARPGPWAPPGPGEPLRLVTTGRLNPVKGYGDLLDALRLLVDGGLDVTLRVAGEDDEGGTGYRRTVEGRVAELGLGDRVTLLGAVDEGRVRDELLGAHLFVLASHDEGVPVALMEAMACGLPAVATAVGGVRELVTHGADGILVAPHQPAEIAEAVRGLVAAPARAIALAMAARRRVERDFDAARGAETLMELMGRGPRDSGQDGPAPPPGTGSGG
jgi:glycosyltransferase involved in cell wall biosynthesis